MTFYINRENTDTIHNDEVIKLKPEMLLAYCKVNEKTQLGINVPLSFNTGDYYSSNNLVIPTIVVVFESVNEIAQYEAVLDYLCREFKDRIEKEKTYGSGE